ncbi:glycosyl hydrolase [Pelagophyceae sp. CCMP2097]|nr:glycosyl hydrolase [Pelagophyceae sp. CCMP2097]
MAPHSRGASLACLVCLAGCVDAAALLADNMTCEDASGRSGPCGPGREFCGDAFAAAPAYHLVDRRGCGENDPNGPVFDPVHGVVHHFYQAHLARPGGHGPVYGHFASKDLVHWAALPVALWNGLDAATGAATAYDAVAVFTGSAVVVEGAGPGGAPGVVQIYPGLCTSAGPGAWPACGTGTVLAHAVPADYAGDALLINWTKPAYNPVAENATRDPSAPWKDARTGEWRLRTFDATVYGAASDADLVAGKWYPMGKAADLRPCECPSFYPLPPPTNGSRPPAGGSALPTHVHKTSCGGDWWQAGTYAGSEPGELGTFRPTPGWEDLYEQRKIDAGDFYASKDGDYPVRGSTARRRINWGWATVPPASAQSLPREVTFNAEARALEQAPIAEVATLRAAAVVGATVALRAGEAHVAGVTAAVLWQSEVLVTFRLPAAAANFTVRVAATDCVVAYAPPADASAAFYDVPVACGGARDTLRVLTRERDVALRVFVDWTFVEVFFQHGRVAITKTTVLDDAATLTLSSTADVAAHLTIFPIGSIWVTPEEVRNATRVFK